MIITFVVYDCKRHKNILITHSARKAKYELHTGIKVEVWSDNACVETIYASKLDKFKPYVQREKEYIGQKQRKAEERNKRRRNHYNGVSDR